MSSEYPSPDGLYLLTLGSYEVRMSHWIDSPSLLVNETKEVLFDAPVLWSADSVEWSPDSTFVRMNFRVYPGRRTPVDVWLYPASRRGKAQPQPKNLTAPVVTDTPVEGSLAEIVRFLKDYAR